MLITVVSEPLTPHTDSVIMFVYASSLNQSEHTVLLSAN